MRGYTRAALRWMAPLTGRWGFSYDCGAQPIKMSALHSITLRILKMKKITLVLIAIALLQGCATSYQPEGFTGGYSETQLEENVFNVSFSGNGSSNMKRVEDFTLLRSAELTLQNGYRYFVIVDADSDMNYSEHTTPIATETDTTIYNDGYSRRGYSTTVVSGGETYLVSRPSASNTIVCYREKPDNVFSYNASITYNSITQKYRIKES